MNWLVFAVLAAAATAAQLTLAPVFTVGRAAPDAALVLVAAIGLRTGLNTACFAGWTLGLLRDLSGGSGPGPFSLMFLGAALVCHFLRGVLFPSRPLSMALGAFVAAWCVHLPYGLLLALRYGGPKGVAVWHALGIALLTAGLGALLAGPFARIRGVAGWPPERELLA
jgi:cell shape-determining protein MreD